MSETVSPIYSLIRRWFEFSFANPDKVRPVHVAVYMWHVELNNRMGWVEKFGSPATQTMAACGIGSYNTYKSAFNELVEWGFIIVIKKSENQFQSNIIALSKNDESIDRSLSNALSNSDKSIDESPNKSLADHVTNHLQHNKTDILIEKETEKPKYIPAPNLFPIPEIKKTKTEKPTAKKACTFRDSEFFDISKFSDSFKGTKYEFYHMEYYYEAVLNWSDSGGAKKLDWLATARNFMLGDTQKSKAVLAGQDLLKNNNTSNGNGFTKNKQRDYSSLEQEIANELGINTGNG